MRDVSRDTDRISEIWRWIHNNIPGEPSTDADVQDVVIRLLSDRQRYEAALRESDKWLIALHYLMEITRTEGAWVGGEPVTYTQIKVWADQARAREALADDGR